MHHTGIRQSAVRDDLGDEDAKRPHVRLDRETIIVGCFRCRPLDWKPRTDPGFIFIVLKHISAHHHRIRQQIEIIPNVYCIKTHISVKF